MIQKELKPNKIINQGNSVFQNHHKLMSGTKSYKDMNDNGSSLPNTYKA